MKTINFELSKRLSEAGLLDDIDTEYGYYYTSDNGYMITEVEYELLLNVGIDYKTLTLEEAIEFLPECIRIINTLYSLRIEKESGRYSITYLHYDEIALFVQENTLLGAIEKTIEYLLDNNLLGKNTKN